MGLSPFQPPLSFGHLPLWGLKIKSGNKILRCLNPCEGGKDVSKSTYFDKEMAGS